MNLDLKKKLDLSKKVVLDLTKKIGIEGLVAQVVLCLDFSYSMNGLYLKGKVQEILERVVPVAMVFDDNGEMELFIFHDDAFRHSNNVTERNVEDLIKREIISRYNWGGTNYAPVIEMIVKECEGQCTKKTVGGGFFSKGQTTYSSNVPTYVIFITDGENSDRSASVEIIKEASHCPVFFQFVGIGTASFSFLNELDTMKGRFIDNANFFHVNDLTSISDEVLYERLLNEFPSWIKEAKSKGLLTHE